MSGSATDGPVGDERAPRKMWLSDLSIRRPHFVTMLMAAVVVVGTLFYSRMALDLFPDVSFPIAAVRTVYQGANPSEVERSVSRPIEDAVASIGGVDMVSSTSQDSVSMVLVQFDLSKDAKEAVDEVRARVELARAGLPSGAGVPTVLEFDPAAVPILSLSLSDKGGQRSPEQLRALVDDTIKPRLERIPGVASVSVSGGRVREVHVDLKRDRLVALGVAPAQVVQALRGENLDVPGGRVPDGTREQLVKMAGEFRSLDEIRAVTVPAAGGGTTRLGEVATVSEGFADERTLRRLNGDEAVVASIQKQSGTNSVAVADAIKRELARIRAEMPDVGVAVASDQSEFTKEAVNDVQLSLVLGALLAALVVFAFFRDWRNTLVTVAGLPVVLLGTFAVMHLLGIGLNMITLMALSLSIGMLIDDAIVVRENIFRHMEAGEEPKVASQRGTAEIALAVIAVSSTIVAVFLPIAFTGGIIGMFLRDFGVTIAVAVLLSLVEAFTLAPMLSAYFFRRVDPAVHAARKADPFQRLLDGLDAGYRRVLGWSLAHRWAVVAIGAVSFLASLGVVPFMATAFQATADQGMFGVGIELPAGARLEETDRVARRVEEVLRRQPGVVEVFATVGSSDGAVERASINVKLNQKGHGISARTLEAARPEIERAAAGAKVSTTIDTARAAAGGAVGNAIAGRPVVFNVQGPRFEDVELGSRQVVEALAKVPGVTEPESNVQAGRSSLQVTVDRTRAADLGVSAQQIGNTVRTLVTGERAGAYGLGDRDVDVMVRLQAADRASPDDLLRLPVATARGAQVTLGAVAQVVPAREPTVIERRDRQRQVVVGANVAGRDPNTVAAEARAAVAALRLPPNVTVKPGGQAEFLDDTFTSLLVALGLAVVFVYMILCSQFGSFIHPFTIMLALPFSIVGALLAVFLSGKALDSMVFIGIILLMGLVTKNSILLVDYTNQLKERGRSTREALLEAGPVRLRPILMTTLAMIFGMIPVAAGLGAGAELRQTMGLSVIGGLITSTVLTLVVVPVAYSLIDGLTSRIRRRRRGAEPPQPAAPAAEDGPAAEPTLLVGAAR